MGLPFRLGNSVRSSFFEHNPPMHDFSIVVVPGAFASSVACTLDILATAATLGEQCALATPRWRICGPQPGPVTLGHGLVLQVEPMYDSA